MFGTDLEGRITSANPAAVRLTGYSREELIGTRVWGASAPEGWQEAYAAIERAQEGGTTLDNVEVSVLSRNGELRDLSISFAPVREADGKLIGSAITLRDQTEFNATRAKLVQAERLAATGQMISAIAHESRNALQRIQIGVDMLGFDLPEDADSRQDLHRISRAKEDLHHLFEDLRNYAAPLRLECQRCSVANIWRQAWSGLESTRAGRDATLIEHIGGVSFQFEEESICNDDRKLEARATKLDCEVDAFRLEQVFRNLFENSLSACDDPIEITICCCDTWIDDRPALAIRVEDNGPGLTPDQRVRLFDAFFTTKQKGTGLGMAIAQRIMSAHFGTISVANADSGGACIELVLPRSFS
ncbi:MAG: ATP-binding protein [Pirellulaceae bacterium]